jgi:hypothetical protein
MESTAVGYQELIQIPKRLQEALDWWKRNRYILDTSTPSHADIERLRRSWRMEVQRQPHFKGGSNIHLPVLRWMVEALVLRLYVAHFHTQPYINLTPIRTDRMAEIGKLEEVLFHYQRQSKRSESFYPIILDAVLLGTGVGFKSWKKEHGKEYPATEYVPLENFFVYPAVRRFEDVLAIGHREAYSIKRFMEEFDVPDEILSRIGVGIVAKDLRPDPELTPETGWGVVWVNRMYFWWEDKWIEVIYLPLYGYILHFKEYTLPTPPYVVYTINRRLGLFGEGVGRLLFDIEAEINELHNLRLDNLLLTNLPVFKVRKNSPAQQIQEFSAGLKVPIETPADIDVLVMPQQFTGLLQEEQQLLELAKMVSGISEIMLGQPDRYTTAYSVESALLEGSVRFKQYYNMGKECLRRDALMDLLLIKQYGNPLIEASLVGGVAPSDMFTEDELYHETEFSIEPNTAQVNRETDRQRWLMIRELFYQTLSPKGRWEIDSRILKLMGVAKPEEILGEKPTEEEEALAQQQVMDTASQMVAMQQLASLAQGVPSGGVPPSMGGEPV